ncbi:MAG: hypothetical protein JWM11_1489 [Planctomycetaceae bacterium]|nr:hypothetical protein [Planctomycetaceae bacterium]
MKRFVTLGISLCLLGFVSGCCCGGMQGCGFRRFGGCNPCGGCGASYAPVAPFGGGCNTCNGGGGILGGGMIGGGFNGAPPVYGGQPGAYYQPYGMGFGSATAPDGVTTDIAAMPYGDPAMQSAMTPIVPNGAPPVATALSKPESLATY